MLTLILQSLWSDFKKHWLGILVTLVLCYIATILCLPLDSGFSWWIQKLTCFLQKIHLNTHSIGPTAFT